MTNDYPSIIEFYKNGNIYSLQWKANKGSFKWDYHRENDKPAFIEYYENGCVARKEWYFENNMIERTDDKPSLIHYDVYEKIQIEGWYKNDLFHRLFGPADINKTLNCFNWYINGIKITDEVYEFVKEYNLPNYEDWTNDHKILFKLRFGD